jgi:peroxiredoxin
MLCVFGDAPTRQRVQAIAESGAVGSVAAKKSLLFAEWIAANGQVEGQEKVLASVESLATSVPANDVVTQLVISLMDANPANGAIRARAERVITERLTGAVAKQYTKRVEGERKLRQYLNKPLRILGVRFNGEMFSNKIWEGRPFMAVFWASTSQASQDQAPEWRRIFRKFKEDGFEVVGISCDESPQEMLAFIRSQPGMTWPQLFDKQQPGWHALATEFGVTELPTVLLYDKAGRLRAINPENPDELIRALLAE